MSAFKTWLSGLTSKATPVDADETYLRDSVTGNSYKLTWANLKATLKTYLDTLYQAVLVSGTNIKTVNGSTLLGSGDLTVSASPGGSTTQVQFNNAGALDGIGTATTDGTTTTFTDAALAATSPKITTSLKGADGSHIIGLTNSSSAVSYVAVSNATNSVGVWPAIGVTSSLTNVDLEIVAKGNGFLRMGSARWGYNALNTGITISGVSLGNTCFVGWSSTGDGFGVTPDVALYRNAAGVAEINNGTAGTYRDLKLRNLIASGGTVNLASFTVATLPSAATAGAGAMAFATDATATTARSTVAGGGSNKVLVFSDASNWLIAA